MKNFTASLLFFCSSLCLGQSYQLSYTYFEEDFNLGRLTNFTIDGNYLYAVTWGSGDDYIMVYDISTGQISQSLSSLNISDLGVASNNSFAFHNGYLFLVADSGTGLHVFDANDPGNIQYVTTYESFVLQGSEKSVRDPAYLNFYGDILFMSYNLYSTTILDISNPASIVVLYGLKDSGTNTLADFIPVSDQKAYLATENNLREIIYSNPENIDIPNNGEPGFIEIPGDEMKKLLLVEDNYLIGLAEKNISDASLFVLDVQSNQVVGSIDLELNVSSNQRMIYDSDAKKIVISATNFVVVDATSFSNLTLISEELDDAELGLAYSNGILYTHGNNNEILHYANGVEIYNNPPTLQTPLADLTLEPGFSSESISLENVFSDPDGDLLNYTVNSSNTSVVTATISNNNVLISEIGQGSSFISVTANDGNGGEVSDQFEVTVSQTGSELEASFAASATSITAGQSVQYTDNSLGNPTSWSWSFPGGSPSSSTNSSQEVIYNTAGSYAVSLTVGDGQTTDFIEVQNFVTVSESTAGPCDQAEVVGVGTINTESAPAWYEFTPTFNGDVIISSAGFTTIDTELIIYNSCDGEIIAMNDDIDVNQGVYQSELTLSVSIGETIYINWTDRYTTSGFTWSLTKVELEKTVLTSDSLALVAFYNSTNGANWTNNSSWLQGPVSTWFGIEILEDRVSSISLFNDGNGNTGNNLTGELPSELNNLDNLRQLILRDNQLEGNVPDLSNLTQLDYLSLTRNSFTGPIQPWVGDLTKLRILALGGNNLSGTLPSLSNLTLLESLFLWGNEFSGNLPEEFWNFTELTILDVGGNQFTGSVPPDISNLSDLQQLDLSSNQLTGSIPSAIGDLSNLKELNLSANEFSGQIPTTIGNLAQLTSLLVFDNNLGGEIPSEIWTLTNLTDLSFSANQFTGNLSSEVSNLSNLEYLTLRTNGFSGSLPMELGDLPNLKGLSVRENNFEGSVPSGLTNRQLEYLRLEDNNFAELPDFSSVSSLEEFTVQNNKFTFEDLEPNANLITESPFQKDFGESQSYFLESGENILIEVYIPGNGNNDSYQWFKDAAELNGSTIEELSILDVSEADEGEYYLAISNSLFPGFTINSKLITVSVNSSPLAANPISDQSLVEGFDEISFNLEEVFMDSDGDEIIYSAQSSDENVVTVEVNTNQLVVEEIGLGESIITVTADDGKLSVSIEFSVTVTEMPLGIENLSLQVFPIPARNEINFQSQESIKNVTLMSSAGKRLKSIKNSETDFKIDVSDYPAGTYLLILELNGGLTTTKKVLISNNP